jgi:hypothetical protein
VARLFRWLRERRAGRDAHAYAALSEMRERTTRLPGVEVVFVQYVYQYARRGTKAIVRLDRTGEQRDAWFWWSRVRPGQMAGVQVSTGWGPHSERDGVLYVGGEHTGSGIHQLMSSRDVNRARRHYERTNRFERPTAG